MAHTTRAIVLHKTNYSESSLVVHVYTLDYGRLSLLIHGAKKKKSRNRSALFEPLSVLELSGNFSNTEKLIRPTDVKAFFPLVNTQTHFAKRLVAMFLAEVLHRCIKENFPEKELYIFIEQSLKILEDDELGIANFHLVFLTNLWKFLGIYPLIGEGEFFSVSEGSFTNSIPSSGVYLRGDEKKVFYSILGTNIASSHTLQINKQQRKIALNNILEYYKAHVTGMGEIKSHHVLETIFL